MKIFLNLYTYILERHGAVYVSLPPGFNVRYPHSCPCSCSTLLMHTLG